VTSSEECYRRRICDGRNDRQLATIAGDAMKIRNIDAFQIFDSRGNPTLEAVVTLDSGVRGQGLVASGVSTGRSEALELRDGDPERFRDVRCSVPSRTSAGRSPPHSWAGCDRSGRAGSTTNGTRRHTKQVASWRECHSWGVDGGGTSGGSRPGKVPVRLPRKRPGHPYSASGDSIVRRGQARTRTR